METNPSITNGINPSITELESYDLWSMILISFLYANYNLLFIANNPLLPLTI